MVDDGMLWWIEVRCVYIYVFCGASHLNDDVRDFSLALVGNMWIKKVWIAGVLGRNIRNV